MRSKRLGLLSEWHGGARHKQLSGLPERSFSLWLRVLMLGTLVLLTAHCRHSAKPPAEQVRETQTGLASYYGRGFHGQETASGETFDKNTLVAAHPSFPLGTRVRVTNLENNQLVEVRIIDRGPAPDPQGEGVIIDLSEAAAARLQLRKEGRARVRVEVLEWGPQ
jgi:rare lipoprotein A